MSNTVTTRPEADSAEIIRVLQNSLYPGAKQESIELVLAYCRVHQIDPLLKPVHIVPTSVKVRKDGKDTWEWRDVLMPGIADYRIKAARTGEYAGKSEPEFGPDVVTELDGEKFTHPAWCRVTVRRFVKNAICDFPAKEYWLENYATAGKDTEAPNKMWRKRKYGQLAKCAEAQSLRMAFPEFSGGAPTAEEMEGKASFDGVTIESDARHVPARNAAPSISHDRRMPPVDLQSRRPIEEQVALGRDIIANGSGPPKGQPTHTTNAIGDDMPDSMTGRDDAPAEPTLEDRVDRAIQVFASCMTHAHRQRAEQKVRDLMFELDQAQREDLRSKLVDTMNFTMQRITKREAEPVTTVDSPTAPVTLEGALPPVASGVGK